MTNRHRTVQNLESLSEGGCLWLPAISVSLRENNDIFQGMSWKHYRWGTLQTMICICNASSSNSLLLRWTAIAPALNATKNTQQWDKNVSQPELAAGMPDLSMASLETASSTMKETTPQIFLQCCKLHKRKSGVLTTHFSFNKRSMSPTSKVKKYKYEK